MEYKEITINNIEEIAQMYVETFNAPPWNDNWTMDIARKRLHQMINVEGFYGMCAYIDKKLCGMILGSKEEYFDAHMFSIKEFCVRNNLRSHGIGTEILEEFEKRLKSQNVNKIILVTSRDDGTEGFYKKRGLESFENMVMMGKQI